jgi:hypothetical protein
MAYKAKITSRFRKSCDALGVTRNRAASKAVSSTLRALCNAETLPDLTVDVAKTLNPETFGIQRRAYVRRVARRKLWLWYEVGGGYVTPALVTDWEPKSDDQLDR